MNFKIFNFILLIRKNLLYVGLLCLLSSPFSVIRAETASTTDILKSKIDERTDQIKKLEEEIKKYNAEVIDAGNKAQTLQNTLKTLDLTRNKITKDITLTETKIIKTNLTIEQIKKDINDTKQHIDVNKKALVSAFQNISFLEDTDIFEVALSLRNMSDVWNEIDNTVEVQEIIRNKSKELEDFKVKMETKQVSLKNQKSNLLNLTEDLNGKKQVIESTTQEKAIILNQTKNKEQAFRELVKIKEEQKAQFEKEVYEYESQLNLSIDRSKYPTAEHNNIFWPLDDIYITQKFGKTVGSEKLYTSGSHNGVDFRATIGTRVKNVLNGVVVGTGNTDLYSGCYSFGKWVMIKHNNGLSTIYGHLSVISVSTGQELKTGDLIGYSGNTGHSTGPHLHISLYATQGVRIEKFANSRGCKQAIIPIADIKAYLDPLAYFPSI